MTEAHATGRVWRSLVSFTIPGDPVGYYAEGARPDWTRREAYVEWKTTVQEYALVAGVRLPLKATREMPLQIHTRAFFRNGIHCDPGNVQKGVCDALFWVKKGDPAGKGTADKYTGGSFPPPLYDALEPRVEVTIESLLAKVDPEARCPDGVERGPLGKPVYCELKAGHTGRHQATSGHSVFDWR